MPKPLRKLCTSLLLVVASGLLASGCDRAESEASRAQRRVDALIAQARQSTSPGSVEALAALQKAAAEAGESVIARAQAKSLVAQCEFDLGSELTRKINQGELNAGGLLFEIGQLGSAIAAGNAQLEGYRKFDAEAVRTAAAAKIAEVRGGPTAAVWIADAGTSLPTVSAVNLEISRLEGEVNKQQEKLKDLGLQKQTLLVQAEDLDRRAGSARGGEAVELSKEVAEVRKKAAAIAGQIEMVTSVSTALQADLAVAQKHKQALSEVIAGYEAFAQRAEQQVAAINDQAQAQARLAKAVMTQGGARSAAGASDHPESLEAKAAALAELAGKISADRESAAQYLRSSAQHFLEAAQAADDLDRQLRGKIGESTRQIETDAWKGLASTISGTWFRLHEAIATQTLGMLQASGANAIASRRQVAQRLKPILAKVGLKMPAGLNDSGLGEELKKARQEAQSSLQEANEAFQTVAGAVLAGEEENKKAARVASIITQYSQWQLRVSADNADPFKPPSDLLEAIKGAEEDKLSVPVLFMPQPAPPPGPVALPKASPPAASPPSKGAPADAATVSEIKAAINDLVSKGPNFDPANIKKHIHFSPMQQPMVDTFISLASGGQRLQKALAAKFGDQAKDALAGGGGFNMNMPSPEIFKAELEKIQIIRTGPDSVELAKEGEEQRIPLKKMDGQWKLDLTALAKDPKVAVMMPMMAMMFKPMADHINQVATDVEAGKYNSVDEVKRAMAAMPMPGAMPGAPPGQPPQ